MSANKVGHFFRHQAIRRELAAYDAGEALPEPQAKSTQNKSAAWLDSLINITLLALFFVPVAASAASRVLGWQDPIRSINHKGLFR